MSEYFNKELIDDIVIITVNNTRAATQHADEISKLIEDEIANKVKKIVVDLSQCKFIDSIFLGALIYASKQMKEASGQIEIVEPAKLPQELFSIPKTLHLLEFYKTREDALKNFA